MLIPEVTAKKLGVHSYLKQAVYPGAKMLLDILPDWVVDQLKENQFLTGGGLLMLTGGILAVCRDMPRKASHWIYRRLFVEFEITIRDDSFHWFNYWLSQQSYCEGRARWLSVSTRKGSNRSDSEPQIFLSPAPGRHWLFWRRRLMFVTRERERDSKGGGHMVEYESFTVALLTRDQSQVKTLLEECRQAVNPPEDKRIGIWRPCFDSWNRVAKTRTRPIESVILKAGQIESLIQQFKTFLESGQYYLDRGLPWRLGCLFYGPPGGGKTSTVLAIASHLKLDIATINLGGGNITDNQLAGLFADLPDGCLVLFEDIDCVFNSRDTKKEERLTFSGVINAIDGVGTVDGRILIMTTNHPEKLDSAFIRPGRCDIHTEFSLANADQIERLWRRFYDTEPDAQFVDQVAGKVSMAALQWHMVSNDTPNAEALTCPT